MSGRNRILIAALLLLAVVAVSVIAFSGSDGGSSTPPPTLPTTSGPVATTPAERVVRKDITVDGNGPVGGVADIRATAGERIAISVTSTGYSGEVHLHGFDVAREVAPGRPAAFVITAAQTRTPKGQGSFELELEATSTQIAKILISP